MLIKHSSLFFFSRHSSCNIIQDRSLNLMDGTRLLDLERYEAAKQAAGLSLIMRCHLGTCIVWMTPWSPELTPHAHVLLGGRLVVV